jgi:hypothetical protein
MKKAALTALTIVLGLGLSACKKDDKAKDPSPQPVAKDDPAAVKKDEPPPPLPEPKPPEPPKEELFTSTEGRYTVNFMGTPTEQVQSQDTVAGKLDIHLAAVDKGNMALLVSWQEQPPKAPKDPKVILDGQRDGMMSSFPGAKLTDQKDITMGTNPGRSFKIRMVTPDATQYTRVFVVGNRMYQVAAISAGEGDQATSEKFLDSFKLIEDAK